MRYELETPSGRSQTYTADAVSFEGGGVQLWRFVERPQAPHRRDLIGAWAPGAWVRLWPVTVQPVEPPILPLLPHVYVPANLNTGNDQWPCCSRPAEDPVHDLDLVVDRREDEDGERL